MGILDMILGAVPSSGAPGGSNPSMDALKANLDPDTLKLLQSFTAQQAPSEEDKRTALKHSLLQAGLGILADRSGNPYRAIGSGGLLGLQGYNTELSDLGKQRSQNQAQAMSMVGMAKQLQGLGQSQGLANGLGGIFGGGTPAPANPGSPMPPADLGGGPPMPATPAQSAPQTPSPADMVAKYRAAAAMYAAQGPQYAQQAKTMADIAQQLESKFGDTPQTVMKDGKPTLAVLDQRGNVKTLDGIQPKQEIEWKDNGQVLIPTDKNTGQQIPGIAPIQRQQDPNSKASNALGYANLNETKRYHNMELGVDSTGAPTNVDAVAKAIANYQQPGLSSFAMAKPIGAQIMGKVMDINPAYDAKNYATAQQTANAFAKGREAQTTRSLNVAMQHLDVLDNAMQDLHNGGMPVFNKVANYIATQTGSPAPGNFNAVKEIVGNEIVKAVVGSGGGVSDRSKAQDSINAAQTPEQLAGVVKNYKQLFGGQLSGLETQYKAGTGRNDFKDKFLHPDTAALLKQANTGAPAPKVVDFASLPGGK